MLRLSLTDAKDREFLEKRGVDLKALARDQRDKSILTLSLIHEKRLDASENVKEKPKKYRNKRIEHDGLTFDSQFELSCWLVLKDLEKQGKIFSLKRQVTVKFIHNGVKLMSSRPDFYFEVRGDNDRVIPVYADAKNPVTAKLRPFRIAQNMFRAFHGAPMVVFTTYTNIEEAIKHHIVDLT